ncbi:helix-turn-helix domain-containing protein [Natrialba sp. INN-245]|uniref:DUF7437 domain-containing protein n=1 Tax=Natrialba sp. INN-245 TaxID=2690967 RepID=UPI00131297E1|nr:helix-turn-helix domain-containing protein [Natrialba sp. INN-245]MWV39826.1 helix-turn-helix domain-containing protein [Natrialba sp. INN-245]
MSQASDRASGEVIQDFLTVADLLEEPQLARLYTYLWLEGEATVRELMDELDLPQGSAYTYVNRLTDAGVLEMVTDEQPRMYAAIEIDLTLTVASDQEYTITPALIDAVGRRASNEDIDAYLERHGIGGLGTALSYAVGREQGETTHRLMARDLEMSPLEAEIILQALRPVVHDHLEIEKSGVSLSDVLEAERSSGDSDEA